MFIAGIGGSCFRILLTLLKVRAGKEQHLRLWYDNNDRGFVKMAQKKKLHSGFRFVELCRPKRRATSSS